MNVYTPTMTQFKTGDHVQRRSEAGLHWTGKVLAVLFTINGEVRYVVERLTPQPGALNIYHAGQIKEVVR